MGDIIALVVTIKYDHLKHDIWGEIDYDITVTEEKVDGRSLLTMTLMARILKMALGVTLMMAVIATLVSVLITTIENMMASVSDGNN